MRRSTVLSLPVPLSWLRFKRSTWMTLESRQVSSFRQFSSSSINGPHPMVPEAEKHTRKLDGKPWKDAASLILVAPNGEDETKTDFLVMKRSKGSTFAPNTLCFPGGVISPADCDRKWINWFLVGTGSHLSEVEFLNPTAPQLNLYDKKPITEFKNPEDLVKWYRERVPLPVALRIAAIRETFEECGILIARPNIAKEARKFVGRKGELGQGYLAGSHVFQDPDQLEEWQRRVRQDPMEFLTLCKELLIRPDLNALVEWSNWLTPNSFGYKRFDTIFYMVAVSQTLPFLNDEYEVATVRWTSADKVLQGANDGKARLIPPQIYELTRLRNTSVQRIQQLMRMRLNMGIERWCPCYIKVNDGIISVFPGDDLYPEDYKIEEFEEIRELNDKTLQQVRTCTKKHHRIEFKSAYEFELVVNVAPRLGQIYVG
ncbi:nucleoside diphosphate-linked moiety X motif 19 isoform X2 [Folsomia candida]|uniref:nucleoside diphosphate-linked moiety X motif 19 isoform X2 n=1 Tax=Folsomia candida TaxID=158441 RepID=UPI000B8F7A7F|nr:nucleoside diphosphate-linked moiety X motif 19 isoform X2 [Folsomia candida]